MDTISNFYHFMEETSWLPILIRSVFLIAGTWFLTRIISRAFRKQRGTNNINIKFLRSAVNGLIWMIGAALIIAQIPMMSQIARAVLAGSGILAVVLGLAAQESFSNLISGLLIVMFRPFDVGDRVHLVNSGITGWIEDITLRHTVLRTFVNSRIIIPNSEMAKEKIENSDFSNSGASSFLDIEIAYESNVEKAMEIMAEIIGSHKSYYDTRTDEEKAADAKKVKVFVRSFEDSGIMLRASMWTKTINENFQACSDARLKILKTFREEGIEIPYQKTVILSQEDKGNNNEKNEDYETREERNT